MDDHTAPWGDQLPTPPHYHRPRVLMTGSTEWDREAVALAHLTDLARQALIATRSMFTHRYLASLSKQQRAVVLAYPNNEATPAPILVHGAAKGADAVLANAASTLGWPSEAHPAQWRTHNDGADPSVPMPCPTWHLNGSRGVQRTCMMAGHRRNQVMAKLGADLCLAFPARTKASGRSKGTWGMVEVAAQTSIPVLMVWDGGIDALNSSASDQPAAQMFYAASDTAAAGLITDGVPAHIALLDEGASTQSIDLALVANEPPF